MGTQTPFEDPRIFAAIDPTADTFYDNTNYNSIDQGYDSDVCRPIYDDIDSASTEIDDVDLWFDFEEKTESEDPKTKVLTDSSPTKTASPETKAFDIDFKSDAHKSVRMDLETNYRFISCNYEDFLAEMA